jgi:DNA modification methylase
MIEKTTHKIHFSNADDLSKVEDNSVSLVVTSPPYPMIEMWDKSFSTQNKDISKELEKGKPEHAFELMHKILDEVWKECSRVLCDGGVA